MSNITITQNDLKNPVLTDAEFRDDTIEFTGADTFAEGTILARQTVDTAVADGVADGGNTGDGTVTAVSVVAGTTVPVAGGYVLTCTTAVTNGGVFKLEDPNGALVASGLTMTVGAGASTVFEAAGLQFTVTDGAADFVAGDFFTLTVVANGKLTAYAIGGAGGVQIPLAILTYEITVTGAEDKPARVGISGKYRKQKLVIDADGDDSNVDNAVMDKLRNYGLVPVDVEELNIPDNS